MNLTPRQIIAYYNSDAKITIENYELARTSILQELEKTEGDSLKKGGTVYLKNDFLNAFGFFDKEENKDVITLYANYPFMRNFENVKRLSGIFKMPDSFNEDTNNNRIRTYLTNTYKDEIDQELKSLTEKDDFVQIRILTSYFALLTPEVEKEFLTFIKAQIENRILIIRENNYKMAHTGRPLFPVTTYFVELAGIVQDNDPLFLKNALSLSIGVVNANEVSNTVFISVMNAHLKLPHTAEKLTKIKEKLREQKKIEVVSSGRTSNARTIWSVVLFIVIFVRILMRCERHQRNASLDVNKQEHYTEYLMANR